MSFQLKKNLFHLQASFNQNQRQEIIKSMEMMFLIFKKEKKKSPQEQQPTNELIDLFPVYLVCHRKNGWRRRHKTRSGLHGNGKSENIIA